MASSSHSLDVVTTPLRRPFAVAYDSCQAACYTGNVKSLDARTNSPSLAKRASIPVVLAASLVLGTLGATRAYAAPGERDRVVAGTSKVATIDWTRGMLVARGEAAADLRAPSPKVARIKAQRQARQKAQERLLTLARTVHVGAQTVGSHARTDSRVTERIKRAAGQAMELSTDYSSDGSVVLTLGLPLESLRRALTGTSRRVTAVPSSDTRQSATAVIIDARGAIPHPSLGLDVVAEKHRASGPTVFHYTIDNALTDSRAGDRVLIARAKGEPDAAAKTPSITELVLDGSHGVRWHSNDKKRRSAPASASLADVTHAIEQGALIIIVLTRHR